MSETGMRIGEVVHLTHDDLTLDGPTPVAHIRPKEVVPGARLWRPKNGELRAVPLSPRAGGHHHKFRHSFCTIAVLKKTDFVTLRRWVGHIDEEALKVYVHIADEQAQASMRQLTESRQAAGRAAKPAWRRQGIGKVSAKSRR